MSPFLVVTPSGDAINPRIKRWVEFEIRHLQERWRATFRGDIRTKKDTEVEAGDFSKFHVILWGDPKSNKLIRQSLEGAQLRWNDHLSIGIHRFESTAAIPSAIFPRLYWDNDLKQFMRDGNCIVLNSGPTFREGHDRTNSQQTPKLPDWAIIGLDKDPDAFAPGEIKAAGFFDENWRVKKEDGK